MRAKTTKLDRAQCLDFAAIAFADKARRAAADGELERAMRLLTLAAAVKAKARGDKLGRKLAMKEARALRFAQRRQAPRGGEA